MAATADKDFSAEINQFRTVNTKDSPVSMREDELPILINFMPIGNTLYTLPGYSAVLGSITPNIIRAWPVNLNGTIYILVVGADGSLYRFNPATWASIKLANAATFSNPRFEQWEYTAALIIDSVGYFSYLGLNAPTSDPVLVAGGGTPQKAGFTNAFSYYIGDNQYSVVFTTWDFWSFNTSLNTTHNKYNAAYLYISSVGVGSVAYAPVAGGYSSAALALADLPAIDTTKCLVGILQLHPTGTGNFVGGTTSLVDGTVVPNCTLTFTPLINTLTNITGAPLSGTAIAVFKGRVWIVNGRTIAYSAPASYSDFTVASSGGVVIDSYADLRNSIVNMVVTQDYLYLIGDHAVHVIFGVQVFSTGSTTFNLIDVIPGIGSLYPDAIDVLGDTAFLVGDAGVNGVSSGSFSLVSSYLDGMFPEIDQTFAPVSCFGKIFNKLIYCILVRAASPIDGTYGKFILCYYEDRWFYAQYNIDLTFIFQVATDEDTIVYGIYGGNIVKLFTGTSVVQRKMRTKAFNFGYAIHDKQVLQLAATITNKSGVIVNATMTAIGSGNPDSGIGECQVTFTPKSVRWINSLGQLATWVNATPVTVPWITTFGDLYGWKTCEGRGKRIQIDYEETSDAQYVLNSVIVLGQVGADR